MTLPRPKAAPHSPFDLLTWKVIVQTTLEENMSADVQSMKGEMVVVSDDRGLHYSAPHHAHPIRVNSARTQICGRRWTVRGHRTLSIWSKRRGTRERRSSTRAIRSSHKTRHSIGTSRREGWHSRRRRSSHETRWRATHEARRWHPIRSRKRWSRASISRRWASEPRRRSAEARATTTPEAA